MRTCYGLWCVALMVVLAFGCADSAERAVQNPDDVPAGSSREFALVMSENAELPLAKLSRLIGTTSDELTDVRMDTRHVAVMQSSSGSEQVLRAVGVPGSETVLEMVHAAEAHRFYVSIVSTADLAAIVGDLSEVPGSVQLEDDNFAVLDEKVLLELSGGFAIPQNMSSNEGIEKGLCFESIFSALGAGQVKWGFRNPSNSGYSIDDEDAPSRLQWAANGTEDVDAIYRTSWGCTRALKVPDSCVAYVPSANGSISCCCNGILYLIGTRFRCQWINPSQDAYFADCPLR